MVTAPAFAQAVALYAKGRLAEAAQELVGIVESNPNCGRSWELLGLIHWRWRDRRQAQQDFETASSLVPLKPEARCGLADCYAAENRTDLAVFILEGVIKDRTSSAAELRLAAAGVDALNRPFLSIRACRAAIRLDPDAAQSYYDLGYYLGRCGAPLSAIEAAAARAIQLDPENVPFRIGLASFLIKHARHEEAYRTTRTLSAGDIATVACRCCVDRLAEHFAAMGDELRSAWCRQRLENLIAEQTGANSFTEPN